MSDLKIVVAGAGGRMGQANIKAIIEADGLVVHAAYDRPGGDVIGKDVGQWAGLDATGVLIGDDADAALEGADAVIDFTIPEASVALAEKTARLGLVHVIGTTGCSEDDEAKFHAAADAGARIVKSGNMSLGVNLLQQLVRQAARALGPEWDAEVYEMHHNRKIDAPSGTALMLGQAVAEGWGEEFSDRAVLSREGITGAREKGTIGFATSRGGNVIGDHKVMLVSPNERIELGHIAQDRSLFAAGAVRAAKWAADKPKGYYSMADVLGLN